MKQRLPVTDNEVNGCPYRSSVSLENCRGCSRFGRVVDKRDVTKVVLCEAILAGTAIAQGDVGVWTLR